MRKTKKIGNYATIVLGTLGSFLIHPLACLPIFIIGFKLVND